MDRSPPPAADPPATEPVVGPIPPHDGDTRTGPPPGPTPVAGRVDTLTGSGLAPDDEDLPSTVPPVGGVLLDFIRASAPTERPPATVPPVVGRYRIGPPIAAGGMGAVFRATEPLLGRDVAVKVLLDPLRDDPTSAHRFVAEARVTGQLQHPGVPPVFEVGQLPDGSPYLAMKLIEGRTLGDVLAAGPRSPAGAAALLPAFEAICQAVGYAHSRGVVHRDLKPSNVMVGAFGEVQVMDWGLAKDVRSAERGVRNDDAAAASSPPHPALRAPHSEGTRAGAVLGTPAYMAPEQARGEPVDARADVFALGGILCAVLTGKPPFASTTVWKTVQMAAAGNVTDAVARLDGCGADPDLIDLAKRCLGPTRDGRPADGGAVAAAVAAVRAAADDRARKAEADRAAAAATAAGERKRRRVVVRAAGAVAAVLLVGAGVSTWQAVRARRAEDATRTQLTRTQESEAKERAARVTAEAVSTFMRDVFAQGSAAGQAATDRGVNRNLSVKEAMDFAAADIGDRFRDQPGVEAEVRNTIGKTYYELGAYPEAAPQFERALALRRQTLGGDHPDTLTSLNNLGNLYHAQGRNADAEPLYAEALATRRKTLGATHPDTLASANSVAALLIARGRFADAEPLFREYLDGHRKADGDTHPSTLMGLNNLAGLYQRTGRYADAEPLFRAALDGRRKTLGDAHPDTLTSVSNLANLFDAAGRPADAEPLYKETLAGRRKVLGDAHPDTLISLNNLAALYVAQARYAEAEPLHTAALAGARKALGDAHPQTLIGINNLGLLYSEMGRYADAEPLYQEALAGRRRVLGPAHPDTLTVVNNLATMYFAQDRFADAEPLMAEARDGFRTAFGDAHPNTLTAVNNLAKLAEARGRTADAERLYRESLAGRRKALGGTHPATLVSLGNLAGLLRDTDRMAAAVPLYEEILAGRRATGGDAHPDTVESADDLALAYHLEGRYGAAVPLFEEVLRAYGDRPEKRVAALVVRSRLGPALLRAGRPADAAPHLRYVYETYVPFADRLDAPNRNRLRRAAEGMVAVSVAAGDAAGAADWRAKAAALPPEVIVPPRPVKR